MMAFHELFPQEAQNECRTLTPINNEHLPTRAFLLVESYCVEPNCDCRRVLLSVFDTEEHQQVATINYAFEPPQPPFDDDGQVFLDPLNPQSSMSDALLELFQQMIDHDRAYLQRLQRHYKIWKRIVNDPSHPGHNKIRSAQPPRFSNLASQQPVHRQAPKIRPNAPCPCGSGRKYKNCCRP